MRHRKSALVVILFTLFAISSADTGQYSSTSTTTSAPAPVITGTNIQCITQAEIFQQSLPSYTNIDFCDSLNRNKSINKGIFFDDVVHTIDQDVCWALAFALKHGTSGKYSSFVKENRADKCQKRSVRFIDKLESGILSFNIHEYRAFIGGRESILRTRNGYYESGNYSVCVRGNGSTSRRRILTGMSVQLPHFIEGSQDDTWADTLWRAKTGSATSDAAKASLIGKIKSSDVLCD